MLPPTSFRRAAASCSPASRSWRPSLNH